jgi:hypothetical protein
VLRDVVESNSDVLACQKAADAGSAAARSIIK